MSFKNFLTPEEIAALQAAEASSSKAQKRTPEQIEAIYSHGNNILVSASAGSGKTFVMVERIVDMVTRGVSVDQLFISTFTVKAARELKERLEKKLQEAMQVTEDASLRSFLNQQINLIQTADIGTMDAFTQKFVNRYGYTLGIPPHFRIMADASEQELLRRRAFGASFEAFMTGPDSQAFQAMVTNFNQGRKEPSAFRQLVFAIYNFSQSTASPAQWLTEHFLQGAHNQEVQAAYLDQLLVSAREELLDFRAFLQHHLEDARLAYAGKKMPAYTTHIETILDSLALLTPASDQDQLTDLLEKVVAISKASRGQALVARKSPKEDEAVKAFKDDYNAERKAKVDRLRDQQQALFELGIVLRYQDQALPLLETLQAFLQDFAQRYLAEKRQEGAFEFSDISHFAIAILENQPEIRQLFQERYVEVMVDEYQDNNHTQEKMLELLSNGRNRFMVGDIKQSIYRFRQADPQIFNQTFKTFQENPQAGQLILLKENFRSQSEVLDSTNGLFRHLMDEDIGDIVYDGIHELVAGSPGQKEAHPDHQTQVLIYDDSQSDQASEGDTDEANASLNPGQIKLVAQEILRLTQEEDVAFSDITLLVPSRTRNDLIVATFDRLGIPLVVDGGAASYLQSVEVMVMLDTLRTIDNPLQDYPLVALLKSSMFAFDEDELARIALQEKDSDTEKSSQKLRFYQKLQLALSGQGSQPQLISLAFKAKLQRFEETLQRWRRLAKQVSLFELIWTIYQDRFYYDAVATLPNAQQRQANLSALALRAEQFERTGFKGLTRFIAMIDKILASENDLANVTVAPPENAVSLMTIHSSKGLEFPYVFILNADKLFNRQDLRAPVILNRDQGIGARYTADLKGELPDSRLHHLPVDMETVPYRIFRDLERRAYLSEQMRLLYVAMTRAEKRLYIVGKGQEDKLADKYTPQVMEGRLSLKERENYSSFQDWFLAVGQAFSEEERQYSIRYVSDQDLRDMETLPDQAAASQMPDQQVNNRQSQQISDAIDRLDAVDQLNARYQSAMDLPSVRTPSQVKKYYEPVMETEGVVLDSLRPDKAQASNDFSLPSFAAADQVTGAAIGSATHELMQRIPLNKEINLFDLEAALAAVDAPQAVKDQVKLDKIAAFFETEELGLLIQREHDKVHREAPFAMLETDPVSQEDYVVRGIVDGYILLDDRIVLFDYKTDRYQHPEELAERYRGQMALYAEALRRSHGIQRVDAYLVLLGGEQLTVVRT